MFKTLTATAAAAAVALASLATPASAELDRGETMRLLIGLGVVGALVAANERQKDRDRSDRYDNRVVEVTPYGNGRYDRDRDRHRNRNARLPGRCETSVPTRRGTQVFYGEPCLQRSGFRARLPRECAYRLDVGRKTVTAYEQRCLRHNGFRT